MRKDERDAFQRTLLQQRRLLLKEVADTEADLAALEASWESELEELAQDERLTGLLDRLDRRAKAEVEEIDRALTRLTGGTYGKCLGCAKSIALARLRALPATPYCIECAVAAEHGLPIATAQTGGGEEADAPPRAVLPEEYALLSDRELQEAVREHLAADGRLDLEELRIVCRHGVVYLDGEVPSTSEHQILLHTLTDVMGLSALVDRVRIEHAPWEREERAPGQEVPASGVPWEEPPGTEDVTEAAEDGTDFDAPTRPLPDE